MLVWMFMWSLKISLLKIQCCWFLFPDHQILIFDSSNCSATYLKAQYLMTLVLGEGHQVGVSPSTHWWVWFLTWFFEPHNLIQCLSELQFCLMAFLMQRDERERNSNHGLTNCSWSAVKRPDEFLTCQICHVCHQTLVELKRSWIPTRLGAFLCHCYCEEGGTENVEVSMRHEVSRGQKICIAYMAQPSVTANTNKTNIWRDKTVKL